MKTIFFGVILIGFLCVFSSNTTEYIHAEPLTISDLISLNSTKYNVPAHTLIKVINCESGFKVDAHNLTPKENSWGLVQINLYAHPNITKKQAITPSFAIDYLAKNIGKVNWTCYDS